MERSVCPPSAQDLLLQGPKMSIGCRRPRSSMLAGLSRRLECGASNEVMSPLTAGRRRLKAQWGAAAPSVGSGWPNHRSVESNRTSESGGAHNRKACLAALPVDERQVAWTSAFCAATGLSPSTWPTDLVWHLTRWQTTTMPSSYTVCPVDCLDLRWTKQCGTICQFAKFWYVHALGRKQGCGSATRFRDCHTKRK